MTNWEYIWMRLNDRIGARTQDERNRYAAWFLCAVSDYLARAKR